MDEEKKDLPVVGADGVQEPEPQPEEEQQKPEAKKTDRTRQTIFYGAAGAYLIYLSIQLVRDLFGSGPVEWTGERIACTIGAVVFTVFGVFLLVRVVTWLKQDHDVRKSDEDQQ